jgi:uncharacterized membrane protein
VPEPSFYHRMLGWHAPSRRRFLVVVVIGLVAGVVVGWWAPWQQAVLGGVDTGAAVYLLAVWAIIRRADGVKTQRLATVEDQSRAASGLLLVAVCLASLLAVGFGLSLAGEREGGAKALLVGTAMLTVLLAWCLMNTVFTLRYADLFYQAPDPERGIDFGGPGGHPPSYRDFAYLAFTIGMTYQVSDTAVPDPRIRRSVLAHALLAYLFGVVIVAGAVNLAAGLFK